MDNENMPSKYLLSAKRENKLLILTEYFCISCISVESMNVISCNISANGKTHYYATPHIYHADKTNIGGRDIMNLSELINEILILISRILTNEVNPNKIYLDYKNDLCCIDIDKLIEHVINEKGYIFK